MTAIAVSSITAPGAITGFFQVRHYYRPPGLPRHKQWWLATVCAKGKVLHTSRPSGPQRLVGCRCLENSSPKRVWQFELR